MSREIFKGNFFAASVLVWILSGTGTASAEFRPQGGQGSLPQTAGQPTAATRNGATGQENDEIERLLRGAGEGDHDEKFQLGVRYARGKGVVQDDAKALIGSARRRTKVIWTPN